MSDKKIIGEPVKPEGQSLEKVHKKANIIRLIIVGIGVIAIILAIILIVCNR